MYAQPLTAHYPTMVQTISNPDGTVSLIQVDPTNTVVTLPDGTQAQLRAVSAVSDLFHVLQEVPVYVVQVTCG